MAQVVKVYLESTAPSGPRVLDINREGLIKLSFDRLLGDTSNLGSNILSNLDLVIRDSDGGNRVLSFIQAAGGQVRLSYGFLNEDGSDINMDMSPIYVLYPIRYVTTYESGEGMISIKAIARQQSRQSSSYMFKAGTEIHEIVTKLAIANGWYIGEGLDDRKNFINVDSRIRLKDVLYKTADMDDFTFIRDVLKPICESTMVPTSTDIPASRWDCRITYEGKGQSFYFRPNERGTYTKRVWEFNYGVDAKSNILGMTNDVDLTFLIKGLTVRIPMLKTEIYMDPKDTKKDIKSRLANKQAYVAEVIRSYNIPLAIGNEDFLWNVELYPAEDVGDLDEETFLNNAINEAIQSISTLTLTIIGNPHIYGTDLVKLNVITRSGQKSILSSTSNLLWKVTGIREEIGLDGYKTHLTLVRERVSDIKPSTQVSLAWKEVSFPTSSIGVPITSSAVPIYAGQACVLKGQVSTYNQKLFVCTEAPSTTVVTGSNTKGSGLPTGPSYGGGSGGIKELSKITDV